MLDQVQPHTTIAVADLDRAKTWYREKLGLEPASEDMGGAWYDCAGGSSPCSRRRSPARPASMGGHKGVWFKDSEGNTLAITQ